jgi:hypothetical protein
MWQPDRASESPEARRLERFSKEMIFTVSNEDPFLTWRIHIIIRSFR